ncbi:PspC domain-containing protein [Zhihengliuella sp.]|uniref:ATP-binding protein n=1 Tax=Zhihengliuella sp. TaxID=1954483 RepID=UPI0028115CFD|nr:PspC domain-containing protein [Zhihengliuella sp.]
MTATATATGSPPGPDDAAAQRPGGGRAPLLRSEPAVLAGVCSGLAAHLGTEPWVVRLLMVLAAFAGGAGLFLYAWLWILLPSSTDAARASETLDSSRRRTLAEAMRGLPGGLGDPGTGQALRTVLIGVALLAAGLLLVAQLLGLDLAWGFVWPIVVTAVGAALVWTQIDAGRSRLNAEAGTEPSRGDGGSGPEDPDAPRRKRRWILGARLAGGLALVIVGLMLLLAQSLRVEAIWAGALVSLVVLAGVVVVLLPWGLRFWRDYQAERASRIRAAERADIAAHLHDSVLQTLALIQQRAGDEAHVVRLARAQERELRQWLYRDAPPERTDVGDAIRHDAAELEARYPVRFDVVTVGRVEGVPGQEALVQAAREAMINAAKHAGGSVSVYVESGPREVAVFVRDRGEGFAVETIAEDRLGVRESIIGRMHRHGGTARIRSGPDGTEVQLCLPLSGDDGRNGNGGEGSGPGRQHDPAEHEHRAQRPHQEEQA